jgi:hypothetical protein
LVLGAIEIVSRATIFPSADNEYPSPWPVREYPGAAY